MLQVKTVYGTDVPSLTRSLNETLSQITSEVKSVHIVNEVTAIIIYDEIQLFEKRICCECQYWDDSQNPGGMMGICQHNGGRKRFGEKACRDYKDIRE